MFKGLKSIKLYLQIPVFQLPNSNFRAWHQSERFVQFAPSRQYQHTLAFRPPFLPQTSSFKKFMYIIPIYHAWNYPVIFPSPERPGRLGSTDPAILPIMNLNPLNCVYHSISYCKDITFCWGFILTVFHHCKNNLCKFILPISAGIFHIHMYENWSYYRDDACPVERAWWRWWLLGVWYQDSCATWFFCCTWKTGTKTPQIRLENYCCEKRGLCLMTEAMKHTILT